VQQMKSGNEKGMKSGRLVSLDALRGLIMVLMAVDHANLFVAQVHPVGEFWGIALPRYESVLAFITRFVTHLCAPGFFMLMGIGMVFFAHSRRKQGWTERRIFKHFLIRGLILIALQFNVENPAWLLGPDYDWKPPGGGEEVWIHFGVLFALGVGLILGALALRLHTALLAALCLACVLCTQVFIPGPDQSGHLYSVLSRVLLIPGRTNIVQVFYPVTPWLGVVLFGIVLGRLFARNRTSAFRISLFSGGIFLLAFIAIRLSGGFGNIHSPESGRLVDMLKVTKYPPSLSFLLMTLGAGLILLWAFSKMRLGFSKSGNPLLVYGRTALFFYLAHLYIYAVMGLMFAGRGGVGIVWMYAFWLLGLLILYPLCKWYGHFKRGKSSDSIWRFF